MTVPLAANGPGSSASHLEDGEDGSEAGPGPMRRGDPWARPTLREQLGAFARRFFSRGSDMEAAGVNHRYTREEKARLRQFESIDYLAPSSRCGARLGRAEPGRAGLRRCLGGGVRA